MCDTTTTENTENTEVAQRNSEIRALPFVLYVMKMKSGRRITTVRKNFSDNKLLPHEKFFLGTKNSIPQKTLPSKLESLK